MYFSTITTKGQITLPAELREKLKLSVGKKVSMKLNKKGKIIIDIPSDIEDLRKKNREFMQRNNISPITDEIIDQTMQQTAKERYERSVK